MKTVLLVALAAAGLPLVWRTLREALRGRFAADLVASLAILAALALGQPIPGLVVVLMQRGGEALERYAEGRASRAVRALEEAAPRVAHRIADAGPEDVSVEAVAPGDLLLVRPGELVPCDAVVIEGRSHLDTASLTGEAVPRPAAAGAALLSGSINQEGALTVRATARAAESQYARIVELVRTAQASKAPLQRVADRYATWFTPFTLAVCAVGWLVSGDPSRVLAVLVVATPCPLILATPVAVVGGINRAARAGIVFRTGGALERIAGVRAAVFDKTGTLTVGHPEVVAVRTEAPDHGEILRLAAAVERSSGHQLGKTLVAHALTRFPELPVAVEVAESPGRGVAGMVDGRQVMVGAPAWLAEQHPGTVHRFAELDRDGPGVRAWVAVDGRQLAVVDYADRLRPEARGVLDELRTLGVRRTVLLSGDTRENAAAVAAAVGIGEAEGDLLPEDKVRRVRAIEAEGERVLMVGDGTNDAPALSAATVGVALAAHGGGVSAEAADVVLLQDDLALIPRAVAIGRRTVRIARQSIRAGLGLSVAAMGLAAAGLIPPIPGAVFQEAVDVAVILNALRASAEPSA